MEIDSHRAAEPNKNWEQWARLQEDRLAKKRKRKTSKKPQLDSTQSQGPTRKYVTCKSYKHGEGKKYLYPSNKSARRQLRQDRLNGLSVQDKYYCDSCEGYHLTKLTKEEYRLIMAFKWPTP